MSTSRYLPSTGASSALKIPRNDPAPPDPSAVPQWLQEALDELADAQTAVDIAAASLSTFYHEFGLMVNGRFCLKCDAAAKMGPLRADESELRMRLEYAERRRTAALVAYSKAKTGG